MARIIGKPNMNRVLRSVGHGERSGSRGTTDPDNTTSPPYTNKAIIQIVVTIVTCGFGAIWGLIEGILILMKNESFLTDANGVPLTD